MKRIRSFNSLPEDYKESFDINFKQSKNFIWLNLLSLFLIIPFFIGLALYYHFNPPLNFITFDAVDLLIYLLIAFLSIIIHELIHGIFFKLGTKERVTYKFHGWAASASVKGIYFYKDHYILTGLAPFIIITPILIISMFIFPLHALGIYFILAIHTSGCVGDFYVTIKLLGYNKETLIQDYGIGMTFYTKD